MGTWSHHPGVRSRAGTTPVDEHVTVAARGGMMTPVSRYLGNPGVQAPPVAVRATTPGWRDPRLWIGVAIVAVSVVAGARLLASADDTVAVWAVIDDMGAGDLVSESDLEVRRVRFADDADLARYFRADDQLPGRPAAEPRRRSR